MTKEESIKKIYSFLDLSPNFDSYGGIPPDIKMVNKVRDFITEYPKSPYFVSPGPNGDILLVYISQSNRYECEIYFDVDKTSLLVSDEIFDINEKEYFAYDGEFDTKVLNRYMS